jgi:hypothetical protein
MVERDGGYPGDKTGGDKGVEKIPSPFRGPNVPDEKAPKVDPFLPPRKELVPVPARRSIPIPKNAS